MADDTPLIHIADDDEAMRKSLSWLIGTVGLETREYASADDFSSSFSEERPGCLILDVRMPGLSGLDLQQTLTQSGVTLPVIFLTGHGDVPMAARAFKAGAFDFLQKPCNDQILLDRINDAIEEHRRRMAERASKREIIDRHASLTEREATVAELVSCGLHNKDIASELGISVKTVEVFRRNAMAKMQADSTAELTRLWIMLKN